MREYLWLFHRYPAPHEDESRLYQQHIDKIDSVGGVIGQQPINEILRGLVWEGVP